MVQPEVVKAAVSEQALIWTVYRLKARNHEYSDRLALVEELKTEGLVALHWLPPHGGGSLPYSVDEIEEYGAPLSLSNRMFPFDLEEILGDPTMQLR